MRSFLRLSDGRAGMAVLLLAFWAAFWGLNGFDKFFNGASRTNAAVTSGVILDESGAVLYRVHPTQPTGWYGVTRDPKFIAYFRTLHLPPEAALATLYAIGVTQIALFVLFATLLGWAVLPAPRRPARGLLADGVAGRLGFKASVLVFYVFIVGDILFGDRMEVWEHGTYLILAFASWQLWHRASREFAAGDAGLPAPSEARRAGAVAA